MRDDETVQQWIARTKREDDSLAVAVFVFCFFALSGIIGLALGLR
jgi:hypothetical protein